jgi:hypothetical protein
MSKSYNHKSGSYEVVERSKEDSNFEEIFQEVINRWKPGNEYLWDDYNIETLINTDKHNRPVINYLLYSRIIIYRELLKTGINIQGKDPHNFKDKIDSNILSKLAVLN